LISKYREDRTLADHLNGPWAMMIRAHGDAHAGLGFLVLIPGVLGFTGTNPDLEGLEMIHLKRSLWESALTAAASNAALQQANVTSSHLALLGYSLGGHVCLRLRHRPRLQRPRSSLPAGSSALQAPSAAVCGGEPFSPWGDPRPQDPAIAGWQLDFDPA
jgi:dienelactone hydrolase